MAYPTDFSGKLSARLGTPMKVMKKADLVLIVVVALLAPVLWLLNGHLFTEKGEYAEIYHGSTLVRRIELSATKEGSFSIPGESDVVFQVFNDESIAFIESNCPDKVCIRSGKQKHTGQIAVCLPNEILLKIVSEENDQKEPDLIIE